MRNKVTEHIALHYLLTEIQLCILINLALNIFLKMPHTKANLSCTSICRIQDYDCAMCRFYCMTFINYMIAGKTLLDYTNLFSPNDFKIIYKYFITNMLRKNVRLDLTLKRLGRGQF